MGGIRSKVEECAYVKKLFDNLGLKVDERNIFMHKDYQNQLDKRLGIQNASVPHVFVNGASLGVRWVWHGKYIGDRFLRDWLIEIAHILTLLTMIKATT